MKNKRPEILAYYFPNWHVDPRNEKWHGKGWTEWNVTKCALPRFPGHKQPKIPLWGYEDESDPAVMEKKIETAAAYGIDGFVFDWYFYANEPYRARCLEEGLMRATNLNKIKFAVMWCNHNAMQVHPACRALSCPILCSGAVNPETFRQATQYCIEHYFSSPSYLRVDGRLYFSIYHLPQMVEELGGETAARALFDDFRERVRQAGLGELHLNAVGVNASSASFADSRSGHSWGWPQNDITMDYGIAAEQNIEAFGQISKDLNLPYNPSIMVGWDSSPRTVQSEIYDPSAGYPFRTILSDATPARFEKALRKTQAFINSEEYTGHFLMLHSWNEWTEGTYLEPDEQYGYGKLEAVKKVFGTKGK